MSDRPPQQPLTEAERDSILREMIPILRDLRTHLANYDLQSHEVERLGGVVANHENRIATVEAQVLAGIHTPPSADPMIPVTIEEPRLDHLSPPPPPPRPPMSTHESINALALETAKQTPILQKTAETNARLVDNTQKAIEEGRAASARWAGAFVAALLLALSQNCSFSHLLPTHPAPPPDSHASTPAPPK